MRWKQYIVMSHKGAAFDESTHSELFHKHFLTTVTAQQKLQGDEIEQWSALNEKHFDNCYNAAKVARRRNRSMVGLE
jgi:hypothetical protein